nr:SCO-spondin-like [Lytechinus pictus]
MAPTTPPPTFLLGVLIILVSAQIGSGTLLSITGDGEGECERTVTQAPIWKWKVMIVAEVHSTDQNVQRLPNGNYNVTRWIAEDQPSITVTECCAGYVQEGPTCEPVCKPACVNGDCVEPNFCSCYPGWTGVNCDIKEATKSSQPHGTCRYYAGHVTTFDQVSYNFEFPCEFKFVETGAYAIRIDTRNGLSVSIENDDTILEFFNSNDLYINHLPRKIPTEISGFGKVMRSGIYIIFDVVDGMRLMYAENSVMVHLPITDQTETFDPTMTGLCGNYDGVTENDFDLPGQVQHLEKLEDRMVEFVYGMQTAECPELPQSIIAHPCNGLDGTTLQKYSSTCHDIQKLSTTCLDYVDFELHFTRCLHEMCSCAVEKLSNPQSVANWQDEINNCQPCGTFRDFASKCSEHNITFNPWRNETFCPHNCQTGMEYEDCGSSCPTECSNLEVNTECHGYCVPGCFCPLNTYWDGEDCVSRQQCMCTWRDSPMPVGAVLKTPCTECICVSASWECLDVSCPSECKIYGGSFYQTFDGKEFNIYTKCKYTLINVEENHLTPAFEVTIDTTECASKKPSDCLRAVVLDIYHDAADPYSITISKNFTQYTYNYKEGVYIHNMAGSIHLSTFFGMEIEFNPETSSVYIRLPSDIGIETMGLCGTLNGSPKDDFRWMRNNEETVAAEFARLVSAPSQEALCGENDRMPVLDSCSTHQMFSTLATQTCNALRNYPFTACHQDVDVEIYVKKCKEDVCSCLGEGASEDCLCDSLGRYARACSRYDVLLDSWRADVEKCTARECTVPLQKFSESGDRCHMSCADIRNENTCSDGYVAGCFCPDNMVFDERTQACVFPSQCPCVYHIVNQRYYDSGKSRLTECGEIHCNAGIWDRSELNCSVPVCPSDKQWSECAVLKTCELLNPVRSVELCEGGCVCPDGMADFLGKCIPTEECPCYHHGKKFEHNEKTKMDCNECTCEPNGWNCEKNDCPGTCTAYGDPHYKTFDGKEYAFMGDCSYILARDTCQANETGTFQITVENEECGEPGYSCTKLINMTIKNRATVTLIRGSEPIFTPASMERKFWHQKIGMYYFVTWAGVKKRYVQLRWDMAMSIYVTVHPYYREKLCGLCGNFDGNSENDFLMPRGNMVETSPVSFAESWKITASCPVTTHAEDSCESNPDRRLWSEYSCAIIKQSLFKPCHTYVDPQSYYDNCVVDSCACNRGGDCECLCTAITAYAKECSDKSISIPWRATETCGKPVYKLTGELANDWYQ